MNEGRSIGLNSSTRFVGERKNFLNLPSHETEVLRQIKHLQLAPMDYRKEIGARIAAARTEKGWTLKELAAKTNGKLDPNRISNYETGFRMPKPAEIVTLAKALGKRPAYMMCLEDAQLPITPQEETLIRNWRALPENERMDWFRKIDARAMTYRDPAPDHRVAKSLGKAPDKKRRTPTDKGQSSLPGDD